MTNKDKIEIAEKILAIMTDNHENSMNTMKCIGKLKTKQGIVGFKPAETDTLIFERGDRYIIILETLDGRSSAEIPYNKETLYPHINFDI